MQEYIERMQKCGISADEAARIYKSMMKDFGHEELEELISAIEKDAYVD